MNHISVQHQGTLTRVHCFSNDSKLAYFTFWVPTSSLDEHGWVPANIIRARVKHGTGQVLGQFSYTTEAPNDNY